MKRGGLGLLYRNVLFKMSVGCTVACLYFGAFRGSVLSYHSSSSINL